jgi:small subunit ribosomal protein S16
LLRIRLSRVGKKKQPAYRIVVTDQRNAREGAHLEVIGHYNPLTNPATVTVKDGRAVYWLKTGAQPSETAAKILSKAGVMEQAGLKPYVYAGKEVPPGKNPKKGRGETPAPAPVAAAPAAAPAATAVAEPPAEAPAVEAPAAEPVAEAPAAEAPAAEPVAEAPAEEPVADAPAEEPVTETPAEEPAAEEAAPADDTEATS